jgi:hypothetical protein
LGVGLRQPELVSISLLPRKMKFKIPEQVRNNFIETASTKIKKSRKDE